MVSIQHEYQRKFRPLHHKLPWQRVHAILTRSNLRLTCCDCQSTHQSITTNTPHIVSMKLPVDIFHLILQKLTITEINSGIVLVNREWHVVSRQAIENRLKRLCSAPWLNFQVNSNHHPNEVRYYDNSFIFLV